MKLKTLNEMCFPAEEIKAVEGNNELKILTYHQVREEAIEWIKELKNKQKYNLSNRDEIEISGFELMQLVVWIKHFFDITESEVLGRSPKKDEKVQ